MVEHIDFWADVRCPWAWGTHRNLRAALDETGLPVTIRHHSFLLEPAGPPGDRMAIRRIATTEWGMTEQQWDQRKAKIEAFARASDADVRIDTALTVNSIAAHQLLKLAAERGADMGRAWEAVFAAHLTANEDLEDRATLRGLAVQFGLAAAELDELLDTGRYHETVLAEHAQALRLGVRGVPTLRLNGELLHGSRTREQLVEILQTAAVLR